jgi:two-component system sensor histidine kinase/response regulator
VLLSCLILLVTNNSLSTLDRDVPLFTVTREIQVDLLRAQIGTYEVLGGDDRASAAADVFGNLARASNKCVALLSGGDAGSERIEPLTDTGNRQLATHLCSDIETYAGLTRRVLADPGLNGEGSAFDERIDTLANKLVVDAQNLSLSLDTRIDGDARDLTLLGYGSAGLVLALGAVITILWSRHRRLRAAQTRELARMAAIVQSSGDAIVSVTVSGDITSWNPGAEALYGYSAAEAVGLFAGMLVPLEGHEAFTGVWLPVSSGEGTTNLETAGLRKDGSEVPLAMTLSPILDGETVVGVSVISRDMTERTAKDLALATARNEALESSRLKSQFLATMSHEIRTPLNGVLGLNELLLQTPLTEVQRQYATGVDSAGTTLLAVINDILDFSKLEAGKVEFDIGSFDPRVLVDEIAGLLAVPAHTKGLELLALCGPEVPTALTGDAGRIRQVLLNLAGNAVKFTAEGEVLIQVGLAPAPDDSDQVRVRFEVRDTGIGLAAEGRSHLFDSFSQADASTTRRFGGTGLGLAICHRLVTGMGGEIGVDSELGQGSTFWFWLPLRVPAAGPLAPVDPDPQRLPGLRVLVVDDNATNRLILTTQLSAWRMVPEAVADASSALAELSRAAAAGRPFDIAVLDLLMPDVDGLELAQRKSADPALAHTRMIMLTSTALVDHDALTRAGIGQWCTKPVRTSELYDRLGRLMATGRPTPVLTQNSPVTGGAATGRILVAEDNEINQLVAEGILSVLGYDIEIVSDGAAALAALARSTYAAVLMDCHMPVMDGFEATRRLRADEAPGTHVPVIAMTAAALTEDRERCLAAGMDGYVSKPVTIESLETALRQWVVEPV